eukprot:m.61273 g.61273  ORF g.61273 m.61273 type:complete len:390 (-) comp11854_c0_seq5:112-1281(-)
MTCVASVNERARNVSTSNTVVAGAATGFITRFAVTPLDVIKIRMQLQAEPIAHGGGKYRGTWHCFQTVVFEEGATALWRGHIAQQLLSVSYSAIQFPLFEYFRAQLAHRIASPTEVDFVAGGAAALGATLVTHPFDTVRTRMASQGRVPVSTNTSHIIPKRMHFYAWTMHRTIARWAQGMNYHNVIVVIREIRIILYVIQFAGRALLNTACLNPISLTELVGHLLCCGMVQHYHGYVHAIRHLIKTRTLYAGLGPNVLAVVPYIGTAFASYGWFHRMLEDSQPRHLLNSLIAGWGAGVLSKGIVYPLDVIKKRLQVQGFEEARRHFGTTNRYANAVHALTQILKIEGMAALYKGFQPTILKSAFSTMITFFCYDLILDAYDKHNTQQST